MANNSELLVDQDGSVSTRCPHVKSIGPISIKDIFYRREKACDECRFSGSSRWLCICENCFYVGCGERRENHAADHAQVSHHQLQMNLKSYRIWCHQCQTEIRPKFNIPPWNEGDALLRSLNQKNSPTKSAQRSKIVESPNTTAPPSKSSIRIENSVQKSAVESNNNNSIQKSKNESAENFVRINGDVEEPVENGEEKSDEIKSSTSASARRLIVPTPGPEYISVADDDEEKRSSSVSNGSAASSTITVSRESAAEKSEPPPSAVEIDDVRVRQFYVTGRSYNDRERPTAVVDSPLEFGAATREEEPVGLTGLRNLSNTCYMNAALQALSNTTPLTEYLLNCRPVAIAERHHNQRCLANEYTALIAEMWNERRPAFLVPYNVLTLVRTCHPMFRGYQQQDAQEFLRYFLDQLHEDLRQPVYPWECQGESEQHSNSSNNVLVRGRESTESADENGESSSIASSSSRSSGVGDGQSDDGAYRTCDSGWISDQGLVSKRTRADSAPSSNSPKRKRSALSECLVESKSSQQISLKNFPTAHRRSMAGGGGGDSSDFSDAKQDLSPSSSKRAPILPKKKALRYGSGVPRKKPIRFRSIVSDVFDGKLLSSVQCLTCNTVSETKETFQDLSIPIPGRDQVEALRSRAAAAAAASSSSTSANGDDDESGALQQQTNQNAWWNWFVSWFSWMGGWMASPSVTLEDCLAAFFSADDLKGDDMYSCDGCKKLRNGVKCCYLQQLPEVLCIHLKRFRHELMYSTKISTRITFPLDGLDLRPFLHRNATAANAEHIYDLYAVICHHGSVESGHYTAYCLNALNGRWYEYDDQCVTEVDAYVVQSAVSAYVLFYRKRSETSQMIREETAALLRRRPDNVLPQFYISQEWINRFNNLSDPGPITNFDFLCPHGCIDPKKHDYLGDLYAEVPSPVWQYLYKKFGGGPVCNKLLHCVDCQLYYRRLKSRRDEELQSFNRIERAYQQDNRADIFFAISIKWFRKWEAFVLNRQEEPPGPIDNSDIVAKKTEKNEFPRVKQGSNYANVHRELWEFFYSTYGGGPEIMMATISSMGHGNRNRSQEGSSASTSTATGDSSQGTSSSAANG